MAQQHDDIALTTIDNPWNPFFNFDEWYAEDILKGPFSCCYKLAKEAKTSNDLSDADNELEIERAIDKIISEDQMHIYRKIHNE